MDVQKMMGELQGQMDIIRSRLAISQDKTLEVARLKTTVIELEDELHELQEAMEEAIKLSQTQKAEKANYKITVVRKAPKVDNKPKLDFKMLSGEDEEDEGIDVSGDVSPRNFLKMINEWIEERFPFKQVNSLSLAVFYSLRAQTHTVSLSFILPLLFFFLRSIVHVYHQIDDSLSLSLN